MSMILQHSRRLAPHMPDHPLHRSIRIDHGQRNIRVTVLKHAEHLVRKALPHKVYPTKVKDDHPKFI